MIKVFEVDDETFPQKYVVKMNTITGKIKCNCGNYRLHRDCNHIQRVLFTQWVQDKKVIEK